MRADAYLQPLVRSTARAEAAEQSRLELESAAGTDGEYVDRLRALRTSTATQRQEGARAFLAAVEKALASDAKRSGTTTSWCPRPSTIGGCVGEDVTDAWIAIIKDDRKIQKTLD